MKEPFVPAYEVRDTHLGFAHRIVASEDSAVSILNQSKFDQRSILSRFEVHTVSGLGDPYSPNEFFAGSRLEAGIVGRLQGGVS